MQNPLLLLRHAKSSRDDSALDDFDCPLNERGRLNAKALAGYFLQENIRPSEVLCSAAVRTVQTLEVLAPALTGIPVRIEPDLYETNMDQLLERLRRLDQGAASVLLIGHNPGIGRLAEVLSAGHGDHVALDRLAEKYPTGTLAVLESEIKSWAELGKGSCRLAAFVRPADL